MRIAIYGLTITSSWGNGHATTYRSLCRALHRRGHHIDFIERDAEWYRNNRDLPEPDFCTLHLYRDWESDATSLLNTSSGADVVVVGSYFPDAINLSERLICRGQQPILFYDIDTPVTLSRLRTSGATEYLRSDLVSEYAAYLSFTGGPLLKELESSFGARRAHPFYCSVDPDVYKPTAPSTDYSCDLSYLGTYAPDRQPALQELLNQTAANESALRFIVAGPQYPAGTNWQPNVRRILHLSPSEHPSFYSSSRFTLNLTRKDMIDTGWSPSVRLFEASACEAVILSDKWDGLDAFFDPGVEILTPGSSVEVANILREMSPDDQRRMGTKARERVLANHTSAHRAQEFESIVSACRAP